jgi:broad specificity phosphatase PhoE
VSRGPLLSRRGLAGLVGVPVAFGAVAADLWAALRTPGHFALIRHALAPGTLDPPGWRLGDCGTQRNLSGEGRAQAVRRANGITAARVYSSQWCRCLDTAALLRLGEVTPQPLLNSFAEDRGRSAPQTDALRGWIAHLDLADPTLLVTHQVVISALTSALAGNGEIVVVKREADRRLTVQGRQPTA